MFFCLGVIHVHNYPKVTDSYLFVILCNSEKGFIYRKVKLIWEFVWEYMQINA